MRKAAISDLLPIHKGLDYLKRTSQAPWMGITDTTVAMKYIAQAIIDGRVWFFGGYMVMVDTGSPWYTTKLCLLEELVMNVYRGDISFTIEQVALAGLDQLASHYGCEATVVGDTQRGLMTPLYIAAGFVPIGTQLFKENKHGLDQKAST